MGEEVKANGEAKQEDKGVSTEETTQSSPTSKTESKKRSLEEDKDSTAIEGGDKDPSAAENEKDKCEQPKSKKTRTEESIEAPSKEESNDSPPKSIFGSSTSSGFGFGSSALKATSTDGEKPISSFGTATGFGSTSTGFGSATSTGFGSSSGFGSSTSSGFKTTPLSAGFGFGTSSSTGSKTVFTLGGSNKDEDSTNNVSPSKSTTTPIVALPVSNEPITNGEENEKAIITLRAKLFKLSDVKVKVQAAPSEEKEEKKVGIQMATKVGQNVDSKQADESESSQPAAKKDWKEVGIGPLRVLTDGEHTRIVQRRENTPGGQGTRLILNVPLRKECRVEKPNDKFVKLAAVEIVENDDDDKDSDKKSVKYVPAHFLFKVKTVAEADSLLETLQKYCGN